jgi:alpha-ketoglutarate-dependent taurine dioxygenase
LRIFKSTVALVRCVPLSPTVGVQVVDFDVTRAVPESDRAEFMEHHLLLVRGQELTQDDHDRFVGYFGPLQEHRGGDRAGYVTNRGDDPRSLFPEMRPLIWHNDGAYGPHPAIATSLWAVEVDPSAAPTLFANVAEIVERLPAALRERAENLRVLNVRDTEFNRTYERVPLEELLSSNDPDRYATYVHPVFFKPPHLDGRTVIASEQMTAAVVDLTPEESDALLSELYAHMYARDNIYEHRWEPGDVIIWDNIALHHARPGEIGTESRHLRRQCIDGWYTPEGDLLDWSLTRRKLRQSSDQ